MKRFKKLSTTFLTTVLLACNTITSPGFDVWAQEEKIPIDNPSKNRLKKQLFQKSQQ
ncbi:hypothetical protein [Faecalicoccus pleomorphus]|uniref:hypothetical protein n=1 Tax=Faecalicoccus pleomorphus TaxID=1323 RepID=UPI0026EB7DEB|nr:hypothetical protein [Faecalicoccus pleomorphus]